jgi:hypothetical protein
MIKDCDFCDKQFDVFDEGNVSQFNVAMCGTCWTAEAKRRGVLA